MNRSQVHKRVSVASLCVLALLLASSSTVLGAGLDSSAGRPKTLDERGARTSAAARKRLRAVKLDLLARHNLASRGLDGKVKPRGQNGDLAVIGKTAFVGGGALFHGVQSTPGRICTDYGGVKVVDLSKPARPRLKTTITIEDTTGVASGPAGNPRRDQKVNNVSDSAGAVDAIRHPVIRKDVLAIATQRCEQSFFSGARIEFWDVTKPARPKKLGIFDPFNVTDPNTGRSGAWGIFEDVRMFTRADQPNKVFAVATTPFSIGNAGQASPFGDFRLLDVTDPANPKQIGTFPPVSVGQSTNNGCRVFQGGRAAAPTPDGTHAILSWYDGAQPPNSPIEPTGLGGPNSAAVIKLDLDNLPEYVPGTNPKQFNPKPPSWGYPPAKDGGETLDGKIAPEGNAADVQPFTGRGGDLLTFVSEDDIDPAITNVSIDAPAIAAYSGRGCETMIAKKLYRLPGQQLSDDVAYVGRGCPASKLKNTTLRAPDEYLEDPTGKIALFESGGDSFNGCSFGEKVRRVAAAGAVGVMGNLGGNFLNYFIPGPAGGIPPIPPVGIQLDAFNKMVGSYVPNRVLSGTAFPAGWERTSTTNVIVRPFAFAAGCTPLPCSPATNTSPIEITTSTSNPGAPVAHGLATGDRVTITGVQGNTAANGTFTITVTSPSKFTLDGSTGNGFYTGGGYIVVCEPSEPSCDTPLTRTDYSRFRSVADPTDRVARGQVRAANRFAVVGGQSYQAGATLQVKSRQGGAFRAAVEWFDAAGNSVGESEIQSLAAVTPRTRYEKTVTAPANATKAAVKFEWSGGDAQGIAYADSFEFIPAGLRATLKDNQGEWGAQRIINFSLDPPDDIATYRSPRSRRWPPPDHGIYAPRLARLVGRKLAFTTWMSDGLRVLDLSNPSRPREVGAYVPRAVKDPSPRAGAGPNSEESPGPNLKRGASWPAVPLVTGVDFLRRPKRGRPGIVVISDINAGLYVLRFQPRR